MIPRLLFAAEIGATAARRFHVRDGPAPPVAICSGAVEAAPGMLSNGLLTVRLGSGGIAGIRRGAIGLLGPGGIGLQLRRDTSDTWTFHTDHWTEPVEATLVDASWRIEETGPLRVRARLDGRIRDTRVQWTVSLYRGESRVHIDLEVNFDERFSLLQMPIDLAAVPSRWTDGIAGAHIERQASRSEWPFLGWSRLRIEQLDIGLVTDDVYSHSVDGRAWQPTLLRSPKMAWGGGRPATYAGRDRHTDQGVHRFAIALVFGYELATDDLTEAAQRQAQPLIVFDRYEGMNRPAWGPVPPRGLWGAAMLRNVAGGRIADPGSGHEGGLFKRPATATSADESA